MVKVKSLTPGYTDEQVTEILNGYSGDYECPMDVIIPLYQMMPNEIKDGLVNALEDWDYLNGDMSELEDMFEDMLA